MRGPGSSPGQALVPGIHELELDAPKTWMAGASPGHDGFILTCHEQQAAQDEADTDH